MGRVLKGLFSDFYRMRYYIIVAAVLFIAGIILGKEWSLAHDFLRSQVEQIADLAKKLSEKENTMVWTFITIFYNNTTLSILMIFSGALLGVIPIGFLLINGMVLGYLQMILQENGLPTWQFLISILPHGIIELPVVILASAYGLRMGVLVLKKLVPKSLRPKGEPTDQDQYPDRAETRKGELRGFVRGLLPLIVFVVASLFIAALIETTVTPWLIGLIIS